MTGKRVTAKSLYTTDQRLLAEIRDDLEALPLAMQMTRKGDLETAKTLYAELHELNDRLDRIERVQSLLARLSGLDPEALGDNELELLSDVGALTNALAEASKR